MNFPTPPNIKLAVAEDQELPEGSFVRIERDKQHFLYPDGSSSVATPVHRIVRRSPDVVTIVAWYKEKTTLIGPAIKHVFLRSAVRAPVMLHDFTASGVPEEDGTGNMWELPAGLVDPHEIQIEGIRKAAARELHEELGFVVSPEEFTFLGKRTFSSPGIFAERLFFLAVEIDPQTRSDPSLDGSPFEAFGEVIDVKLDDALNAIDQGYIYDAKTEIALRRFARMIG